MKKITDLSKLKINAQDDNQIKEMMEECNRMIDQLNAIENPNSPQAKTLKMQIVNYKNKIDKIKKGY